MKRTTLLPLIALGLAMPLVAASGDTTHLGATVASVAITKTLPPGNLGLKNASASKLASRRDLVVTGDNPRFTVTGQVFCKSGARLTAVQVVTGKAFINNTEVINAVSHGQSPKLTHIAGRKDADVEIPVELKVTRRDSKALVDFTFNPARTYEQKLLAYVKNGHTAAEYLRETQAFDLEVSVSLIAWCKMDPEANSVLAGKTYPGIVTRKTAVTVLYNGDPAIIDGPAARATASTRESQGGPPAHN